MAIRSAGGTNFGLAWSVVARTKSRIACFAGPSFQDGRTLDGACPIATTGTNAAAAASSTGKAEIKVRRRSFRAGTTGFMQLPRGVDLEDKGDLGSELPGRAVFGPERIVISADREI